MTLGSIEYYRYTSSKVPLKARALVSAFSQASKITEPGFFTNTLAADEENTLIHLFTLHQEGVSKPYSLHDEVRVPFGYDDVDYLLSEANKKNEAVNFRPENHDALRAQLAARKAAPILVSPTVP